MSGAQTDKLAERGVGSDRAAVHPSVLATRMKQMARRSAHMRGARWVLYAALGSVVLVAIAVRSARFEAIDFRVYEYAAERVRTGQRLYDGGLGWRELGIGPYHPLIPQQDATGRLPYLYPPPFAVASVALFELPFAVARSTWLVASLAALVALVATLVRLLGPTDRPRTLGLVLGLTALAALMRPARLAFATGQVDVILVFLIGLALAGSVRGWSWATAVPLAAAASVKPFLGLLVLLLIWKRAYRSAILAGLLWTALVGGSSLMLGDTTFIDFVLVSTYLASPAHAASPLNQSPYGMLLRAFVPNDYARPIIAAPLLAEGARVMIVVAAVAWAARAIGRDPSVGTATLCLEFGVAVVTMLMVSPVSQTNHYALLILVFVVIALALGQERPWESSGRWLLVALALVYGYFVMLNEGLQASELHVFGLCAAFLVAHAALAIHRRSAAACLRVRAIGAGDVRHANVASPP